MKAWFTQSPLNIWCWDVSYLNSEAFIWAAIWGAVNSHELILCSRVNSWVFLSCGGPHESHFHHSAWWFLQMHLKKLEMFRINWPSCLKVMMDYHFPLLIWAVLAIIWTWSLFKYGYLLYTSHLVTTQLIGSNALKRKKSSTNELLTRHTC